MNRFQITPLCLLLAWTAAAGEEAKTGQPAPKPEGKRRNAVLFDSGEALAEPGVEPRKFEEEKWTRIGGAAGAAFKGDAVLCNNQLTAVARKDGVGVDLYAPGVEGWIHRARLAPLAGAATAKFGQAKGLVSEGSVSVEFQEAGGASVVFSLTVGEPLLKATAKGKAEGLRVTAPCRWGVLPDFFTDDLLVDARQIQAERVEIPSEHFFLQMLGGGASILALIWSRNERDIQVNVAGEGEQRNLSGTDVYYGQDGSIWAGTLERKGLWYSRELAKGEEQKGTALDWEVPFQAKWKGNFTRADGLVASQLVNPWFKEDKKGGKLTAAIPPTQRRKGDVPFEGPFLAYPLRRADTTPLDQLLLDDLMRQTLGSGPCEYILDVSGRTSSGKGIFTCSYDWTIPRMLVVDRKEEAAFLKEERVYLRTIHRHVLTFMRHIQDRIGGYVAFRGEMLKYLEEQAQKSPELAPFIGKLKEQVAKLPAQKPAGDQKVIPLLQEVEKAIQLDSQEQMAKSLGACRPVPNIAEWQDDLLAACRRNVKLLRATAVLAMVKDPVAGKSPAASEIVKAVREKSQAILRNPAHHEGSEAW